MWNKNKVLCDSEVLRTDVRIFFIQKYETDLATKVVMRLVCLKIKLIYMTQQLGIHTHYQKGNLLGFMQDFPVLVKSIIRLWAGSLLLP